MCPWCLHLSNNKGLPKPINNCPVGARLILGAIPWTCAKIGKVDCHPRTLWHTAVITCPMFWPKRPQTVDSSPHRSCSLYRCRGTWAGDRGAYARTTLAFPFTSRKDLRASTSNSLQCFLPAFSQTSFKLGPVFPPGFSFRSGRSCWMRSSTVRQIGSKLFVIGSGRFRIDGLERVCLWRYSSQSHQRYKALSTRRMEKKNSSPQDNGNSFMSIRAHLPLYSMGMGDRYRCDIFCR